MPTSTIPQFLQAGCPSCRPTNSVKALKATQHGTVLIIFSLILQTIITALTTLTGGEAVCHEEDIVLVLTENADELIRHIMSSTCLLVHPFNWTSGAENTLLGRTVLM